MILLNTGTGIAPNVKSAILWQDFSPWHFPNFWSVSHHFHDSCHIPGHFQIFHTSDHLKYNESTILKLCHRDHSTDWRRITVRQQRSHAVHRTLVRLRLLVFHRADAAVVAAFVRFVPAPAVFRRHYRIRSKPHNRRRLLFSGFSIRRRRSWVHFFRHLWVRALFRLVWRALDVMLFDIVSVMLCRICAWNRNTASFPTRPVVRADKPFSARSVDPSLSGDVWVGFSKYERFSVIEGRQSRHPSTPPARNKIMLRISIVSAATAAMPRNWLVFGAAAAFHIRYWSISSGRCGTVRYKHRLWAEQLGQRRKMGSVRNRWCRKCHACTLTCSSNMFN